MKLIDGKTIKIRINVSLSPINDYYVSRARNKNGKYQTIVFWTKKDGHNSNGISMNYKKKKIEKWIEEGAWEVID